MIANDYTVPLQLAARGMVNSLSSDNYFESFERYSKSFSQDFGVAHKRFEDYQESLNISTTVGDPQTLENNLTNTFSLQDHNYDINVAFHMSPTVQLNTMPPPPHGVYVNGYTNNNNNITTKNYNKRGGWKNHSSNKNNNHSNTPQGYDSDESNKSHSSRDTPPENNSTKHKIPRNGYRFPYEHTTIYSNYRYNNNNNYTNTFCNTVPLTHHHSTNGFSKRFHSNNGKRSRREYKHHYSDDIDRRVHGLMERFTSKAKLFQISPIPPAINNSPTTQLDQSIWDLFTAKAQTEITYFNKLELWKKVYLHITKLFDRYGLFMVGSTMSGLGTENSDIDMCLLLRTLSNDPRADAVRCLEMIRNSLENCDFIKAPEVIHAKVPILKFRSSEHGFEVDLNCNNAVGIRNTHLLHCYTQLDWRVRPLVIIVKLWAQANCINNAKNMTISSYSLALMVIHFLQCGVTPPVVPCLHGLYQDKFNPEKEIHEIDIQEELPDFHSDNNQTLGELLLGFLQYYAYFNYETYAISVRLASRVLIDECRYARSQKNDPHQWKYLCIEEPFDLTNTARSVYDLPTFKRIQKVFQDSCNVLRETANLSCILMSIDENQR